MVKVIFHNDVVRIRMGHVSDLKKLMAALAVILSLQAFSYFLINEQSAAQIYQLENSLSRPAMSNYETISTPTRSTRMPPVYSIYDGTSQACKFTQNVDERFAVCVEALNADNIKQLVIEKKFILNEVTLADQADQASMPSGTYSYAHAAKTLSHLNAIHKAYQDGHEHVLFILNHVNNTNHFSSNWKAFANAAPQNWNALQWVTNNPCNSRRYLSMVDPWISWQPDHSSTDVFMLSRGGMSTILNKTMTTDPAGNVIWHILEPKLMLPHEVIFYLATHSYTSTYQRWFDKINDTQDPTSATEQPQNDLSGTQFLPSKQRYLSERPEKVLVIMSLRVANEDSIYKETQRLIEDSDILGRCHNTTQWQVKAVVTNENLKTIMEQEAAKLPPNIRVAIVVDVARFNKFTNVRDAIHLMRNFDLVVVKDNDMSFCGFPWKTLLKQTEGYTISGPLYETQSSSLARYNEPDRQHYIYHDAAPWKRHWSDVEEYRAAMTFPVPFVEGGFAVFDGGFAAWYFSQVLAGEFCSQPADWGIDKMWCGAAQEYDATRPACSLSTFVITHLDTRQISRDAAFEQLGKNVAKKLYQNSTFARWLSPSDQWDGIVAGKNLIRLRKVCMRVTKKRPLDFRTCARPKNLPV